MSLRIDNSIFLPPVDEIRSMEDMKEWARKVANLLNNNQSDLYQDVSARVDRTSTENITGAKTMTNLILGGNMNCNGKQMVSMVIENRTSDPDSPVEGQMWLRTDLL